MVFPVIHIGDFLLQLKIKALALYKKSLENCLIDAVRSALLGVDSRNIKIDPRGGGE